MNTAEMEKPVKAQVVADYCECSTRTVYNMDKAGLMPRSARVGRTPVWFMSEVHAWLRAGSPVRDEWEKKEGK